MFDVGECLVDETRECQAWAATRIARAALVLTHFEHGYIAR